MTLAKFDRVKFDLILAEFDEVLRNDPKGIDPADDTMSEVAYLCIAVKNARDKFRFLSLGAAPGEWALRAERVYRKLHPSGDYQSLNIEGDIGHVNMTTDFWRKNGANLEQNILRYSVVAAKDGWAYFPLINSEKDWGAGMAAWSERSDDLDSHITIDDRARGDRIAANGGKPLEFAKVKAFGLSTLLEELDRTDFIHCDIQGHELEVFSQNMTKMSALVGLVCVATHSTAIEIEMTNCFHSNGWDLGG